MTLATARLSFPSLRTYVSMLTYHPKSSIAYLSKPHCRPPAQCFQECFLLSNVDVLGKGISRGAIDAIRVGLLPAVEKSHGGMLDYHASFDVDIVVKNRKLQDMTSN